MGHAQLRRCMAMRGAELQRNCEESQRDVLRRDGYATRRMGKATLSISAHGSGSVEHGADLKEGGEAMRRILRHIAHAAMAKAGLKRVNKCGYGGKSFFATHWREWA